MNSLNNENIFNIISIIRNKKKYIDYSAEEIILADIYELSDFDICYNVDFVFTQRQV